MTIADSWNFTAETAPLYKDNDNFPPIEEILYTVLQERGLGLIGEYYSTVSSGEEEVVFSDQKGHAFCSSISVPGNSLSNIQSEYLGSFS